MRCDFSPNRSALFGILMVCLLPTAHGQLTNGTLNVVPADQSSVSLQWSGFSDQPLNVQRSTSLPRGQWTTLAFSNSTGAHVDSNPPADKAFYRLVLPSIIHVSPGLIRDNWLIFGDASMNAHDYGITISNSGPAVLTVTGIERRGDLGVFDYSFSFQSLPFHVPPANTKTVNVRIQTYFSFTGINESFTIRSSATSGNSEVQVEGSTTLDPSVGLYWR